MSIREISAIEFDSIVDNHKIREMSIDVHNKTDINQQFPAIDIGISTHCESGARKILIHRYTNRSDVPISDQIVLTYDPIISIGRNCLFVRTDDINLKRLDSIRKDIDNIKFYLYDPSSSNSMVNNFKDSELREIIEPYDMPSNNYDVVVLFETRDIRHHLEQIEKKYSNNRNVPIRDSPIKSKRQEIVDEYISGFTYKHMLLIVILVGVIISFSMAFGVDDIDPANPRNIPPSIDPIAENAWNSSVIAQRQIEIQ